MRKLLLLIGFILLLLHGTDAQQWAGPDTATCGKLGVMIGSSDACEDCCYNWSPIMGLSDATIKNPIAKPGREQVYTVHVTDKNLQSKGMDQCTVRIGFGEMQFTPDVLLQGDPEAEVRAELLKHEGIINPSDIIWTLVEDTTQSNLVAEGIEAIISSGDRYGTVTVEARKAILPECYVRGQFPVNNGVKEVMAVDPNHTERIAKSGQTLYLIDHALNELAQPVIIHAVLNPAGNSDETLPDWKPDSHGSTTPMDGQKYFQISEDVYAANVTSEYIAGDAPDYMPKVTVVRMPSQPTQLLAVDLLGLFQLADKLEEKFKFIGVADTPPTVCATPSPINISITTPVLKFERTQVEKYNDPGTDYKEELSVEVAIDVTGRIYHPVFTKSFNCKYFPVTICSKLFAQLSAGTNATVKMIKDPSQADPTWRPEAAENEIGISLGVGGGLELGVAPDGFQFLITGTINASYKVSIFLEGAALKAKGTLAPLTLKVEAKIQEETDPGKFEDILLGLGNLSGEVLLFEKKDTDTITLYNFN